MFKYDERKSESKSIRLKPSIMKYIDDYQGDHFKRKNKHSFNENLEDILNDFIGKEADAVLRINEKKDEIVELDEIIENRKAIIKELDCQIFNELNKKMESIKELTMKYSPRRYY